MISRVAEHCFWMSRYLERAENTARVLEVNQTLLLDMEAPMDQQWKPPLRSCLMLLPDLLIAYHITGKDRYLDFYQKVVARFKDNPDTRRKTGPFTLEGLAHADRSNEGQDYEALYNLIRYEHDPDLLKLYHSWVDDLWVMNWMDGNPLFTWMTVALLPELLVS